MLKITRLLILVVIAFSVTIVPAFGQFKLEDGRTITVTTPSTLEENVYIGRETSKNHLVVKDGGTFNVNCLYLGDRDGADENHLFVSGQTTSINCQTLSVGDEGKENTVEITDGAKLIATGALSIGVGRDGRTKKNSVLVSGTGSHIEVTYINLGHFDSADNSLTLEKGATGEAKNTVFIGRHSEAENNSFYVTGAGSRFLAKDDMYIGHLWKGDGEKGGRKSALLVSDGGVIEVAKEIFNYNDSSVIIGNDSAIQCSRYSLADRATLEIQKGGKLTCAARLTQDGQTKLTINAGGTLSGGVMYTQSKRATLEIWIGANRQNEPIVSAENISASGKLCIEINPEVELYSGDMFQIFGGTIDGRFSRVSPPSPPEGLQWDDSRLYSEGILSIK